MKPKTLELIAICVKAATGVVGGSLVLTEKHPYLTLTVLAIGAVSNEIIIFIHKSKTKKNVQKVSSEMESENA